MLVWLTLILAVLAGLFVLMTRNGDALDAMPAGLAAAGVIIALLGLYIYAQRHRWHSERGTATLVVLGSLAAVVVGGLIWWYGGAALNSLKAGAPVADALQGTGPVSVLIRRDARGAFVGQGRINGAPADFLIDTGSASVMLKPSDAERAGVDVSGLTFTTPVKTANGTVYTAPVRLRSIEVGLLRVDDVEALVAQPGTLNENLLGISFLRRLQSYTLKGDFLMLRQ